MEKVWSGPRGAPGAGGDHHAGVHAAAEEGADRHVADEPALHRGGHESVEFLHVVVLGPAVRIGP